MENSNEYAIYQSSEIHSSPNNNATLLDAKVFQNGNFDQIQYQPPEATTPNKTGVDVEHHFHWRDSGRPPRNHYHQTGSENNPQTAFLSQSSHPDLWGLSQSELIAKLLKSESQVEYLQNLYQKEKKVIQTPVTEDKDTCTGSDIRLVTPTDPPPPHPLAMVNTPLETSESFALVPSPCVTTPPYEYIVLTKNNEKKLRIFVNPKIDSAFKEKLSELKSKEGEDKDGKVSKNDPHLLSPTPSILPLPHKSSDGTIIHCFDPSDVDVELKNILKSNPPLTHRIVRRKSRAERGSSVPAIDSYYGTQDLERVGHASYFIPDLTLSERKIIGWKEQYSYGLWKYSKQKITDASLSSAKSFLSRVSLKELVRKSKSDGHRNKTCITTCAAATHKIYYDGCKDINPRVMPVVDPLPRTSRFRAILRGHDVSSIDSIPSSQQSDSRCRVSRLSRSSSGSISEFGGSSTSSSSAIQEVCFAKERYGCGKNKRRLKSLARFFLPCYKQKYGEHQNPDIHLAPLVPNPDKKNEPDHKMTTQDVGSPNLSNEKVPSNANICKFPKSRTDIISPNSKFDDVNANQTDCDEHKSLEKEKHNHHHSTHHGRHHLDGHRHGHQSHSHHHHHRETALLGCFHHHHHRNTHRADKVLGGDVVLSADDSIIYVSPPTNHGKLGTTTRYELVPITPSPIDSVVKTEPISADSENLNNNNLPLLAPLIPTTFSGILLVKHPPNLEVTSETASATISTVPSPSMQVSTNSFYSGQNEYHEDLDEEEDYADDDDEIGESQFSFNTNSNPLSHFGLISPLSPHQHHSKKAENNLNELFESIPETRFLDFKDCHLGRYQYKKPFISFNAEHYDEEFENDYYDEDDGDEENDSGGYSEEMNNYANNNFDFGEYVPNVNPPNASISLQGSSNNGKTSGSAGSGSSKTKIAIDLNGCKLNKQD